MDPLRNQVCHPGPFFLIYLLLLNYYYYYYYRDLLPCPLYHGSWKHLHFDGPSGSLPTQEFHDFMILLHRSKHNPRASTKNISGLSCSLGLAV